MAKVVGSHPGITINSEFKGWIFTYFHYQLTFEDEDVSHLQDPDTGEINKDNFVAYR